MRTFSRKAPTHLRLTSFSLREEEALTVLADLHGYGDTTNGMVQLEFEEIKEQVYFERTEGAKSYFDLLKPGVLHRVSLGASLQMWSQLSGVNLMMCVVLVFCCCWF